MKVLASCLFCLSLTALLSACAAASAAPLAPTRAGAATAPTRYAQVGDARIGYRVLGSGTPLLLANRMRGTLDTWDPLFLDELARAHTVIPFDYPGTGYSEGTLPTDVGAVAEVVVALARELGLGRFAILGWSWGGLVSQALVVEHPEFVTHAILVGTSPPGEGLAEIQEVWRERALRPVNDLADEEILFFEPASAASRAAARSSRARIYARPDVVARIPATMAEFQAFFAGSDGFRADRAGRRAALTRCETPLLILCGDNDTAVPATNWYPLVGAIPKGHLVVLPESGHGPQHQYPILSAAYVAAFLRSAEG